MADYATTGLTLGPHPLALLRPSLPAGTVTCEDLGRLPHESPVRIGGLVVARQRPGTAKGIVFILLEDEFGTINLIVPPPVYERHRLIVRAEPLIIAEGRLESLPQAGGAINVYVRRSGALVDAGGRRRRRDRAGRAARRGGRRGRGGGRAGPRHRPQRGGHGGRLPRRRPGRAELRGGAPPLTAGIRRRPNPLDSRAA